MPIALVALVACSSRLEWTGPPRSGDDGLKVYLLAGQSNMDGVAFVTGLPPSLQIAQPDVRMYWSAQASWTWLAPASTVIFSGIETFGPEVTFGRTLADQDPAGTYALVKHAVGGTDLASYWNPGESRDDPAQGQGYRDFLTTVDGALAALDAEGTAWTLAGMIWMQGESDALTTAEQAKAYGDNLTHFVARVRDDVGSSDLPFALAKIHCPTCPYRDIVRDAEDTVAATVPGVVAFETDDLPINNDNIHYDGSGMRTLGERFAQALLGLPLSETASPAVLFSGASQSLYAGEFFLGYTFTFDRAVTVTDLGTLDSGGDGLSQPSTVALYEADTKALLARATVPAASTPTAPWGGWRFVAIEPLDLEPGSYTIASQVFDGSTDVFVHDAAVASGDGFSWVEGLARAGTMVYYPDTATSLPANWFGPNLLYLER